VIDVHCHLDQEEYASDREEVIGRCKGELRAIVTCCAHPSTLGLTLRMVEEHRGFVFASAGVHPEYSGEVSDEELEEFLRQVERSRELVSAVGEVGLDYWWAEDPWLRRRQEEVFRRSIRFAKELDLPLIVHSRAAYDETVGILEGEGADRVLIHMFGASHLLKRVTDNGWSISTNAILFRSKKHMRVVEEVRIDRLMLETDAPWLAPKGGRNDPLSIKLIAEKVAEVRGVSFEEIDQATTENAIRFFGLRIL